MWSQNRDTRTRSTPIDLKYLNARSDLGLAAPAEQQGVVLETDSWVLDAAAVGTSDSAATSAAARPLLMVRLQPIGILSFPYLVAAQSRRWASARKK